MYKLEMVYLTDKNDEMISFTEVDPLNPKKTAPVAEKELTI
jgi:hypothetical protein